MRQKGFTIVEVLIVVAIIGILVAILLPELHKAKIRAQAGAVLADAKSIYNALKIYQVDNSAYLPSVQPSTLEPMRSRGMYNGTVTRLLVNAQIDAYDSPDDKGTDQEFWIEMTLSQDPTIRFLISDSDDAPLSGGLYLDGVYRFDNGVLTPL